MAEVNKQEKAEYSEIISEKTTGKGSDACTDQRVSKVAQGVMMPKIFENQKVFTNFGRRLKSWWNRRDVKIQP